MIICYLRQKDKVDYSMKDKIKKLWNGVKKFSCENVLLLVFLFSSIVNSFVLRAYTVKNYFSVQPVLAELGMCVMFSILGFAIKPKRRVIYYSIISVLFAFMCGANSVYYTNYRSFISFSLLATASQLGGVANAVTGYIMEPKDIVFIWAPIFVIATHFIIKKKAPKHYENTEASQKGRKMPLKAFICGLCMLGVFALTLTGTDWSRLRKQWNREYVLGKFGMTIYQLSDIVSSVAAKFNTIWGFEESQQTFTDFYDEEDSNNSGKNAYTGIFEGKNIIAIHAESIQNFTLGTYINGKELTPNLNKLVDEGIYFSNFYAQESVGTSSDSEFTFSTSLLPATSGTVAINYWDRNYMSIQKLLKEKGYYTFSMHGNNGSYWNRLNLHASLGYDKLYHSSEDFNIDESIGLGLSDKSFFRQAISKIQGIDMENENFYGVMIMLTNHTPFTDIENYSDYTVDFKYKKYNLETRSYEEVSADFLEGTSMGSYLKSVHYADEAIGQFINDLDSAGLLDDTVIVIYGDHDAKIKEEEYEYYYNYNPFEDEMLDEDDDGYIAVDEFTYNINRSVPFIIWSKDMPVKPVEVTKVMGMYDCLPTLGNMFGFESEYALGTDIFSLGRNEENVVVFPNASFITDTIYYDSQTGDYFDLTGYKNVALNASCNQIYKGYISPVYREERDSVFKTEPSEYSEDNISDRINNGVVDQDYIDYYTEYAEKRIEVSNAIIFHNLIEEQQNEQAEENAS